GPAFMEPRWAQELARTDDVKGWLKQAENFYATRNQPVLPAFQPVTVTLTKDEAKVPLVVYKSYWGLHAVNLKTGKLEWETPSAWSMDRMARDNRKLQAFNNWVSYYVNQNQRPGVVFENSTVGTLSTDGTYAYVVEDFQVPPPPYVRQGGGNPGNM